MRSRSIEKSGAKKKKKIKKMLNNSTGKRSRSVDMSFIRRNGCDEQQSHAHKYACTRAREMHTLPQNGQT